MVNDSVVFLIDYFYNTVDFYTIINIITNIFTEDLIRWCLFIQNSYYNEVHLYKIVHKTMFLLTVNSIDKNRLLPDD